jgi:putative acetyltransferase
LTQDAPEIVSFSKALAPYFSLLNREWIERFFAIEEADQVIFADPFTEVIKPGGQIFFVIVGGEIVGTCAVVRYDAGIYELARMAVRPEAQGRGYGSLLIKAAIEFAREAGAEKLFLLTNSILRPALRLYEKHGFKTVPLRFGDDYVRADVQMELFLQS